VLVLVLFLRRRLVRRLGTGLRPLLLWLWLWLWRQWLRTRQLAWRRLLWQLRLHRRLRTRLHLRLRSLRQLGHAVVIRPGRHRRPLLRRGVINRWTLLEPRGGVGAVAGCGGRRARRRRIAPSRRRVRRPVLTREA
jgi:hypothetical protein